MLCHSVVTFAEVDQLRFALMSLASLCDLSTLLDFRRVPYPCEAKGGIGKCFGCPHINLFPG